MHLAQNVARFAFGDRLIRPRRAIGDPEKPQPRVGITQRIGNQGYWPFRSFAEAQPYLTRPPKCCPNHDRAVMQPG